MVMVKVIAIMIKIMIVIVIVIMIVIVMVTVIQQSCTLSKLSRIKLPFKKFTIIKMCIM